MSVSDYMLKIAGKYGHKTQKASEITSDVHRLPTGVFPFDLASGGGLLRGKVNLLYGPESGGKSMLSMLTMAHEMARSPDKSCVLFDLENSFDPNWAKALGVDLDRLHVVKPMFAEEVINILEGVLQAEDLSVVVVDSVAALITENELDSDASKMAVGSNSLLIGKFMRKMNIRMSDVQGPNAPTLILLNQLRYKVGVMYGDPENVPGGKALHHTVSMMYRVSGKNIIDKKIDPDRPAFKEINISCKKHRANVYSMHAKFQIGLMHGEGVYPGYCDEWPTLQKMLKDAEVIRKGDKGWLYRDQEFDTLKQIRALIYSDIQELDAARNTAIQEALKHHSIQAMPDVNQD